MNTLFNYLNFVPMPLWLAMMFFPNHPVTRRASRSSVVFGLAGLHYLVALGIAMRQGCAPGQQDEGASSRSLDGVRAMLNTRPGTLVAWSHMLALDLFTGAWIYRECQRLRAPALVRIPSLFFTLMTGPLGLIIFLAWRTLGRNQGEALSEQS